MAFQLSDRAKALIPKARIVSFASLEGHYGPEAIARLKAADDGSYYLTDEDGVVLDNVAGLAAAAFLRDNADEIVTDARQQVLAQHPGITQPGGALYPEFRARACWRDFWQFLRCITYGIATGCTEWTSVAGLAAMNELYIEMQVPLPAMVTGLEALKVESLKRLPGQEAELAPYFDHLLEKMRAFA
jgi:hypothetical protein